MKHAIILILGLLATFLTIETVDAQIANPDSVDDIAWSSNGLWIAKAFSSGTVEVIDVTNEQIVFTFNNGASPALAVAWNPMNSSQLAASIGHDIFIWDISTGQTLFTLQDSSTQREISTDLWTNTSDAIVSLDWSNDGTQLVSMSRSSLLQIWDASTGSLIRNVTGIGQSVAVSWSPQSNEITATDGFTIRFVDADTGSVTTLPNSPHGNFLSSIDWSPDNTRIAVATVAGEVNIWEVTSGQFIQHFDPVDEMMHDVAWHPDSIRVASGAGDGSVYIWDGTTGEQLQMIQSSAVVTSVAWSFDGTQLAYGTTNGTLEIVSIPALKTDIFISSTITD